MYTYIVNTDIINGTPFKLFFSTIHLIIYHVGMKKN